MRTSAFRISLIYLAFGLVWIWLGDYLLSTLPQNIDSIISISYFKGTFFVLLTASGLFFLIRKNEERLLQTREQYLVLFRNSPYPMIVYDIQSLKIIAVNNSAVNSYGYDRKEFQQLTIKDIRPTSELHKLEKSLKDNRIYQNSGIWLHRSKTGREFYAQIHSHSTNFNNRPARAVIAIDVDEQVRNREKILMQNDRLMEIAQMQAHDFRGPIASILGLISILDLDSSVETNKEVIRNLKEVAANLDHVSRLVVDKTQLARQIT